MEIPSSLSVAAPELCLAHQPISIDTSVSNIEHISPIIQLLSHDYAIPNRNSDPVTDADHKPLSLSLVPLSSVFLLLQTLLEAWCLSLILKPSASLSVEFKGVESEQQLIASNSFLLDLVRQQTHATYRTCKICFRTNCPELVETPRDR